MSMDRTSGPIVVGELNPYGADPYYALYDEPKGASGDRLRRIFGLSRDTYARLDKRNICDGKWSIVAARLCADSIISERRPLILLGSKVHSAFGYDDLDAPSIVAPDQSVHPARLIMPHPSGLCRRWREPGIVDYIRDLLNGLCPSIPWGEAGLTLPGSSPRIITVTTGATP